MSKGGGGGPSGPQEVVQTTSNLPEYARPYFEEMLGRTMYETTRPYEAYPGQRLADFTQFEREAMQGLGTMQQPGQIGAATQIAERIGMGPTTAGIDFAKGFDPVTATSYYSASDFDPGDTQADMVLATKLEAFVLTCRGLLILSRATVRPRDQPLARLVKTCSLATAR